MNKIAFGLLGLLFFTAVGGVANVFSVKQVVTFSDGSVVDVYYSRDDGVYSCFSEVNLFSYSKNDFDGIVDSNFEVCLEPKGALVYQTNSVTESIKLARKFVR